MRNFIILFVVCGMISSCDSPTVVSGMTSLPNGQWNQNEVLEFSIPPMDSLKAYNVFIHLRNNNEYPFNNIFLIANMEFPHGKSVTDTLEYRMAAPDGTWLGTGIGSLKESKLWYKEDVRFLEEGTYILSISQAVRNNGSVEGVSKLLGITEVGYSIEVATP